MNTFFVDKVALITGGTSGIGLAAAQKLKARGARVAITGRNEERGTAAADQLGDSALYIQGDMKVAADVKRAVDRTVDAFGGLDILVNSAARSQSVLVADESLEEWDDVVRSVLYSVFHATKYAVPHLEARGGGAIVNIGSAAGLRPTPLLGAYAAAKAGVLNLTQLTAQELRDKGIRVNAINPGWILTPIIESVRHDFDEQLGMPLDDFVAKLQGRWGPRRRSPMRSSICAPTRRPLSAATSTMPTTGSRHASGEASGTSGGVKQRGLLVAVL